MFKWLADMIVKTPVQGTCSCCEGKKEQLRKMQKAILENNESENESLFEHDSCSCGGKCHCSNHSEENTENSCHCHKEKEKREDIGQLSCLVDIRLMKGIKRHFIQCI